MISPSIEQTQLPDDADGKEEVIGIVGECLEPKVEAQIPGTGFLIERIQNQRIDADRLRAKAWGRQFRRRGSDQGRGNQHGGERGTFQNGREAQHVARDCGRRGRLTQAQFIDCNSRGDLLKFAHA